MTRIVSSCLLGLTLVGVARAGIITVSDGTFADADWQVVTFSFGSTGGALPGGSVVASQQPGGYPGTMRQVTNNIPAAPSGSEFASVFGIHLFVDFTYHPSVQGPIGSIDYFEDARNSLYGQLSGFAVRQDGKVYYTQAGVHGSTTWGRISQLGIGPGPFYEVYADGQISDSKPDFSAAGAPLEIGFVRASSNGNGGGAQPVVAAIDNWMVRINPPCLLDADCDDGDACTTETCTGGVCAALDQDCDDADGCTIDTCVAGTCGHTSIDCDDADTCTVDGCTAGACTHSLSTDYATVTAKIDELLVLLAGPACGDEPLAKKLRKKIVKKLKKAGKALAKADDATKDALIETLLGKVDTLLLKARTILVAAVDAGLISPTCAGALFNFIAEIQICADGLPQPPA